MSAGKLVVSTEEISQIQESAKDVADQGPPGARPLMSPIPWWGRIALSLLVLFLPLLCLIAIILRVAFRNAAPRLRYAWTSFLSTLLIISGFLTTASAIVIIFAVPVPVIVGSSLPDFDDRSDFPQLPVKADLNSSEASRDLKPLVIVVSPAMRMWRSQESASGMIGAGVLLYSDQNGYLFATARHMIAHGGWNFGGASAHEMIAGNSVRGQRRILSRRQNRQTWRSFGSLVKQVRPNSCSQLRRREMARTSSSSVTPRIYASRSARVLSPVYAGRPFKCRRRSARGTAGGRCTTIAAT